MFDQISAVNSDNSFQGAYNKLVLERLNNRWYIVDDIAATASTDKNIDRATSEKEQTKTYAITNTTGEVTALVNKWVASWKSGDMKSFRNCYASTFKARNMNLNDWVDHKDDIRKRSKKINIRIDNLRITADTINATASFTQYYSSSILKSKSSKKLEIKKIDGEWKILRETI
jgi:hypothetical protein